MIFQIPNEKAWVPVLAPWLDSLKSGDIVLLEGPMAAGKTTLVRSALEHWGVSQAASPTYALHHRYQRPTMFVEHWDLYRLKNLDELESTSFWDLLQEESSIIFIEWPGLIPISSWPEGRRIFRLEIKVKNQSREVQITQLS